jgi:hypothetical protein
MENLNQLNLVDAFRILSPSPFPGQLRAVSDWTIITVLSARCDRNEIGWAIFSTIAACEFPARNSGWGNELLPLAGHTERLLGGGGKGCFDMGKIEGISREAARRSGFPAIIGRKGISLLR